MLSIEKVKGKKMRIKNYLFIVLVLSGMSWGMDISTFLSGDNFYTTPRTGNVNGFQGRVGFVFSVDPNEVIVYALGRLVSSAPLQQTHTIELFEAQSSGPHTLLMSAMIGPSNPVTVDNYAYQILPTPITLVSGREYVLLSTEFNGGDRWEDASYRTNQYQTSLFNILGGLYTYETTGNSFPIQKVYGDEAAYGSETMFAVTRPMAINPFPGNGQTVPAGTPALSWTNTSDVTACDVYIGTDPNELLLTPLIVDQDVEIVSVALEAFQDYYWRVDCYNGTEPNAFEGMLLKFDTKNAAPVVDAGVDQQVWLTSGSVEVVMNATVTDDGIPGPCSVQWTFLSGPEGAIATYFPGDTYEDPTVTLTIAGDYEFQLNVSDGDLQSDNIIAIKVFENACAHAAAQPGFVWNITDNNYDCIVDLSDLAVVAQNWLLCNASNCFN